MPSFFPFMKVYSQPKGVFGVSFCHTKITIWLAHVSLLESSALATFPSSVLHHTDSCMSFMTGKHWACGTNAEKVCEMTIIFVWQKDTPNTPFQSYCFPTFRAPAEIICLILLIAYSSFKCT